MMGLSQWLLPIEGCIIFPPTFRYRTTPSHRKHLQPISQAYGLIDFAGILHLGVSKQALSVALTMAASFHC
jgi:hypothetical protein